MYNLVALFIIQIPKKQRGYLDYRIFLSSSPSVPYLFLSSSPSVLYLFEINFASLLALRFTSFLTRPYHYTVCTLETRINKRCGRNTERYFYKCSAPSIPGDISVARVNALKLSR